MARVLAGSNHLHHPRYVGHQVTSPLPLGGAVRRSPSSLLNNGMAVYEMGPVVDGDGAQRCCAGWRAGSGCRQARTACSPRAARAGNLTALLAARQAKAGFDAWDAGRAAGRRSRCSSRSRPTTA